MYLRGFKGCLFSHSGSPPPQALPEICIRGDLEGIAYQFTILPFDLCLAPRTFMKCMDVALSPLKQSGMRILNYIDNWQVLAQSESALLHDKLRLLAHILRFGLTVNMQKNMLVPSQNIFLGVASTRRLYAHKWRVFSSWCISRGENPISCPIPIICIFLQERFDSGRMPSTLKVYVAAITALHIENRLIGRNDLIIRFSKGAKG